MSKSLIYLECSATTREGEKGFKQPQCMKAVLEIKKNAVYLKMFIVWTHLNPEIKNKLSIFLLSGSCSFRLRDRNVAAVLKLTYFSSISGRLPLQKCRIIITEEKRSVNLDLWNRTLLLLTMVALGWCEFLYVYKAYVCHGSWWDVTQPLYFPIFSLSSSHSISCNRSLPWWSELVVRFRVNAWKQKFKNPLIELECASPEQVLFLEHTCQGGSAGINNPTPQPV